MLLWSASAIPTNIGDWKAETETKERVQRETTHREQEERERPQLACFAAQLTIKERLRDASVARFPSCLQYPGHVTAEHYSRWIVHSWVELPDASGVYRQHGYEAAVDYDRDAKQYRTFILSLR